MLRKIDISDANEVARLASHAIERWLQSLPDTVAIRNVELDPEFQARDIDLLWTTTRRTFQIEIKGDRWHQTGNFFLETHSNKEMNTPGCFLYTEADYVFYYFVTPRELYCLPMPQTRDWFRKNIAKFAEKATTTPVGNESYTTVGRLVPIRLLMSAVKGVRKVQL